MTEGSPSMTLRNSQSIYRDASFMDRTTEFDSTFHHRPTIPHSQHMTQTSNQSSHQANQLPTFHQNSTKKPSAYQPVNEEDGYIYDEYYEGTYEQPYAERTYEGTYEQPYAVQYQPGNANVNQRGQAGRGHD